ncbi:TonB-dependent receptor [Massilia sp. DWR3-1-1]|uniref:TonB-dependent receptor n=1 Tax=Massilia sp. DWR3-1-1 TaxID=2804559 RepID=UPI003CEBD5FE
MFRKTVVARALTIAFSSAALSVAVMQPVMAQSSATGNVYGTVDAPAGATVNLLNTDTGLRRTASVDGAGRYSVTALPIGHYRVELIRAGKVAQTAEVDLIIGQGVEASFVASTGAVQKVEVSGRRSRIDVSNTNNGAVFTARELAKLPVASNLSAVILLAPNTTKGDSAYGNANSFGGGGVSENSYYINGLPVTNPLTQTGSTELPFGAIAQASVITGGFGAEFGRSIGGVLNVTTKSGTNNWEAGALFSTQPNSARSKSKNIYYDETGNADNVKTNGKLYQQRDLITTGTQQYGVYMGGPLIKDKLFMFYAIDQTETRTGNPNSTDSTTLARDGWFDTKTAQTRYVLKLDWNLNDNNRFEFTSIGDNSDVNLRRYGLNADGSHTSTKYSERTDRNAASTGSYSNALKYVGQITDDVTFTGLYGQLRNPRGVTFENYDVNSQLYAVSSTVAGREPGLLAAGGYTNFQKFSGNITPPGTDNVKSYRADLEWKLGSHTVRAGLDRNDMDSTNAGLFTAGGGTWTFRRVPNGTAGATVSNNVSLSRPAIVANYGGLGTQGYYVTKFQFSSLTSASASQQAQYLEDRWQVTKNLLVTGGIRNDQYTNSNGDGVKFIDMKREIAPRLAASWDVNGDSSVKVFGSAGRYYLQLPTQVAARAASRSTYIQQDFTYTGIDALGQPTGLTAINQPGSPDGELGQAKDPRSVVMKDLKPNYQDEVTLGFEQSFNPSLNFGAKLTYRKLGAGIDDSCDTRPMLAYSDKVGLQQKGRDYLPCYIFNPGSAATLWVEGHDNNGLAIPGSGRYVTFTEEQLGFPKAERKYKAVDLFAEHPMRNGWYGKINYTWSRSTGNMEGQTNSDTGQLDVATTANWDYPEFMAGTNGVLPNDRTHQLKAFGFYQLTPEWSIGGNALVQSGRPKVCIGTDLDAEDGLKNPLYGATYGGPGYGNVYMWCNGSAAPRGTIGRMPFEKRLDMNLVYSPSLIKGLAFKVDVFNVFNKQEALTRQETYDAGDGAVQASYNRVRAYQTPRSAKFTVQYDHKF